MKASDLIKKLQELIAEHGDLEVVHQPPEREDEAWDLADPEFTDKDGIESFTISIIG